MKDISQCHKSIDYFIDNALIKYPNKKITNINTDATKRDENFCIFIMTFGRADKIKTYKTLMEYEGTSLNQDFYLICSDDDKQLRELTEFIRKEAEGSTGWPRLGNLLLAIGHFHKAEELYTTLLQKPSDDCTIANIYNNLGLVKDKLALFLKNTNAISFSK